MMRLVYSVVFSIQFWYEESLTYQEEEVKMQWTAVLDILCESLQLLQRKIDKMWF